MRAHGKDEGGMKTGGPAVQSAACEKILGLWSRSELCVYLTDC